MHFGKKKKMEHYFYDPLRSIIYTEVCNAALFLCFILFKGVELQLQKKKTLDNGKLKNTIK